MTLQEFFDEHHTCALAFSGGTDSAYLLYEAVRCGADVTAYFVKTQFQPAFELRDAKRLAKELHARMRVIDADILAEDGIAKNPKDRCYHCKKRIFGTILHAAAKDGFTVLLDGTNASDEANDRPGMRALAELAVLSPLRLCGLTKEEIRTRSREAGLFTADKPAYACLATRIPSGMRITEEALFRTERAEEAVASMGFTDFRVRTTGDGGALLQVKEAQMEAAVTQRQELCAVLQKWYPQVMLDLQPR